MSLSVPPLGWPIAALLGLVVPLCAAAAAPTEYYGGAEVVARRVLVRFVSTPAVPISVAVVVPDADEVMPLGNGGVHRIHSRSRGVGDLLRALRGRPDVAWAEPDYLVHGQSVPDDPSFGSEWGLRNVGQAVGPAQAQINGVAGADIGATAAWNSSVGSRTNVVAIVDSGIAYQHPDLAANVWSAPSAYSLSVGGIAISCAAGSHGYNFVAGSCDPADDEGHGTHVAGTIGAVGDNGIGVSGVNQVASLMALKFLDNTGNGAVSDAVSAIDLAIALKTRFGRQANVRILSASWGGAQFSQALLDAIGRAAAADMLFVAAAGNSHANNDTAPQYPSSYPAANLISVGASDPSDRLATFSDYGATSVQLVAPGVDIFSTYLSGGYAWLSGTSMATPHVSGAAALVLARCSLDTAGLRSLLLQSTDRIAGLAGLVTTGGRLNVASAMRTCTAATPSPTATPAPTSTPTPTVTPSPAPSATPTAVPTAVPSPTPAPGPLGGAVPPGSTGGSGGGCAFGGASLPFDPLLPALLAAGVVALRRRR